MTTDSSSPLILVVDRNRHNVALVTQFLQKQGYQVVPAISLEEGIQIIGHCHKISLALVDISGFDQSIWTLCQQLREQEIPFLVISLKQHVAIQQASIVHGALGLLGKPLIMQEFSRIIRDLLKRSE